jgi:hypothetical protein
MEWKPTKSSTGFLPLSAAATETIDSIPGLRESLLSQSETFKSNLRSTNTSQVSLETPEHEPSASGFSGLPVAPCQIAASQSSNTEASNNEAGDMASTFPPQPASNTDVEMEDVETEDTPQSDEPEKIDNDKNHCCWFGILGAGTFQRNMKSKNKLGVDAFHGKMTSGNKLSHIRIRLLWRQTPSRVFPHMAKAQQLLHNHNNKVCRLLLPILGSMGLPLMSTSHSLPRLQIAGK